MKRVLTILIICILCVSTFSIFTPHGRALDLFSLLWTKNTAQTVCSIAVGDINRDGKNEVVYSDWTGTVYAVDSSGNALWTYPTGWYGKIAIGDLRGDGRQEVVVASANHNIYCLDGATGTLLWKYGTAELAGHGDLVLVDINGDGKLEVVTGEWDSNVYSASPANVYVIDCNGNLVWKYTVADDVIPTASDVNNDGKAEVVAYYGRPQLVSTGYLYMFTANGQVKWSVSIPGCAWMIPLFVDLNGDGTKEIVTCRNSDNAILVFRSSDGYLLKTISQSYGWLWDVADLNHDGQFEFLTSSGSVVSALDSNGNKMWQASVSGSVYSLVSVDLRGDGLKEVVVGSSGKLTVLSSTGTTMWSTTMKDNVEQIRVANIAGDWLPDIIAGTSLPWPNQTPPETVSVFQNGLGAPSQIGSISGIVFYIDPDGNVVPIQGAQVGSIPISTTAISGSQGKYILQNLPYGHYMVTCVLAGAPTRTEYAEISGTNSNAVVHFCMLAQILDNLQGKATAALNNVDFWLQTVAQHIDNFAAQYQLQVGQKLLEEGLSLILDGTQWSEKLPLPRATSAVIDAIVSEYVSSKLVSSMTTPLADIINQYHLSGTYGLQVVRYENWFAAARQQIEQSFGPSASAALFKYPIPVDPEMKAYIQDVSDHFERIANTYLFGSQVIDGAISELEGTESVAWEFYDIGEALAAAGVAAMPVTLWFGGTVAAVGAVTAAASATIAAGDFVGGYSEILLPDYVRFAEEASATISHLENSLSDAFTKAGNKNMDPSIGIPGVQVASGGNPSFSIKNPSGADVSVDTACFAQLDFPGLVGKVATTYFAYTFEEPTFTISSGTEKGFNMYYPPNAVSWIDDVRTKITSPTELSIELTVYADYGTTQGAEYASRKQIMIWTVQEYPVNYDDFQLHSSCDLHIFDSNGNHVGINYTSGEVECQIPHAYYTIDGTQQIMLLDPSGIYTVRLIGTGNGEYHLEVRSVSAGATTSDQWVNGTITNGQTIDYRASVGSSGIPTIEKIQATLAPVGGYSLQIQVPTKTEPLFLSIALMGALAVVFTKLKPKTKRKR